MQVHLIPFCLRNGNPMREWPSGNPTVQTLKIRPKQHNNSDCGIFVCKYVDCFVRANGNISEEKWSLEDVTVFRYRVAWELYKKSARLLPASEI